MIKWVLLLGGLLVWAAHFFLLYAFASLFPDQPAARILTLLVTVPALAADLYLIWHWWRGRGTRDEVDAWIGSVSATGAALSLIAIVWQAVPALVA